MKNKLDIIWNLFCINQNFKFLLDNNTLLNNILLWQRINQFYGLFYTQFKQKILWSSYIRYVIYFNNIMDKANIIYLDYMKCK